MVHYLEMYSNDDGDEKDDDVVITSGLQHSLKIKNYASTSSSPIATHDYNRNDDDASSYSNHSTIGYTSGHGINNEFEDNHQNNVKDAKNEDKNDDANVKVPFVMASVAKKTTAMRRTTISHLPMPLLLLALH
jgi:hypothetical protein